MPQEHSQLLCESALAGGRLGAPPPLAWCVPQCSTQCLLVGYHQSLADADRACPSCVVPRLLLRHWAVMFRRACCGAACRTRVYACFDGQCPALLFTAQAFGLCSWTCCVHVILMQAGSLTLRHSAHPCV